ncbi:MAG: hypothetical protein ACRCYS_16335, partial [Beijerinckiaceae bacterium]
MFGSLSGRATVFDIQGELYLAARSVVIQAGAATLEAQALTTSQSLTLPGQDIPLVNEYARQSVSEVEGLSLTDVRSVLSDLAKSIDPASPEYQAIGESLLSSFERLMLIRPTKGLDDAQGLVKLLELSQISNDPQRADDLAVAYAQGIAAAGETFNTPSFLAALRTSGAASTLTGEGLFRFMLAFDEQQRQLGSGLGRLIKSLTSEAGVSEEQIKLQQASGIRDADGQVLDENLLRENAFAWVMANVIPKLEERGVDTTDPVAVQSAIGDLGFVTQEARLVASELVAELERARSIQAQAAAGLVSAQEASRKDLGASVNNLKAAFDTLASESLTPLFETIAPGIDLFANYLENLALNSSGLEKLGIV